MEGRIFSLLQNAINLQARTKSCGAFYLIVCRHFIAYPVGTENCVFVLFKLAIKLYMISLCNQYNASPGSELAHPSSLIRFYILLQGQLQALILISLKMNMENSKKWKVDYSI